MATSPEQLQTKPVSRIKAAETQVSAFLPHKNLVNSLLFDTHPIPVNRMIFFLLSLSNTIILDRIFVTPVKTSTAVSQILILPEENLQPGEIINHALDGFWKSGSIFLISLQRDGENLC